MYIRLETLDHRILVDLLAPPCCATITAVGDLGHSSPDTVTWSERYSQIKEMKKGAEKRELLSKTLPFASRFHVFFATFPSPNGKTQSRYVSLFPLERFFFNLPTAEYFS